MKVAVLIKQTPDTAELPKVVADDVRAGKVVRLRQGDYEFWTSPLPGEIVDEEGIIVLDYRPLQAIWREKV